MADERIGISLESSNLVWSDYAIKDIDRVTAIGMAKSKLGILLVRAYIANDAKAISAAISLATKQSIRHMRGVSNSMRGRLCAAAVHEFLSPMCQCCGGTGKSLHGQKWGVCQTCDGTARKRHSDNERARRVGIENIGQFSRHYAAALDMLHTDYMSVIAEANGRLK